MLNESPKKNVGDRPSEKLETSESVPEFREEVNITIENNLDNFHLKLVRAAPKVERQYMKKKSLEVLQDEVCQSRDQMEGTSIPGDRTLRTRKALKSQLHTRLRI